MVKMPEKLSVLLTYTWIKNKHKLLTQVSLPLHQEGSRGNPAGFVCWKEEGVEGGRKKMLECQKCPLKSVA